MQRQISKDFNFAIPPLSFHQELSGGKNLALGENSVREAYTGCGYGRHAEMDAISKLPPNYNRRKRREIDLIVIRVDRFGCLKASKPCFMCVKHLNRLNIASGYRVGNVYYSTEDGNVTSCKFSDLLNDEDKHVSYRFRK